MVIFRSEKPALYMAMVFFVPAQPFGRVRVVGVVVDIVLGDDLVE